MQSITNPLASPRYGGMYAYENVTATPIDTASIFHATRIWTTGATLKGFTFVSALTGPISAFADYGGTVAGTVKATDTAHGLTTGNIVTIAGTTSYNGVFAITVIDADNFYFTDTWVANDATGNWYRGNALKTDAGSAGVYLIAFSVSVTSAGNTKLYHFAVYKNATILTNISASRLISTGADEGNMGGTGMATLADGDYIGLYLENETDATDLTIKHANFSMHKIS